jgi:hypothetical protein
LSLLIGLDLDNTILRYDRALRLVAEEEGCVPSGWDGGKKSLRDFLRGGPGGDERWQKVQAKIYGTHIDYTEFYAGFVEFVHVARAKGHRLVVVSHKTEVCPVDESRILLRVAAIRWLESQGFFSKIGFSFKDLHFCATQDEKCHTIADLHCDVFIDDLPEVFENRHFPKATRKIHFTAGITGNHHNLFRAFPSWRSITHAEFGFPGPGEIIAVCNRVFPDLDVSSVEPLVGRANSKVFRLRSDKCGTSNYFLKIYPDRALDCRKRLETEWSALDTLHRHGLRVPKPVLASQELNWAIYDWVDGNLTENVERNHISQAIDFLKQLNRISADSFSFLQEASEACLSGAKLESQIRQRFEVLRGSSISSVQEWILEEVAPFLEGIIMSAKERWPDGWQNDLPREDQILSPSDYGFHNTIESPNGSLVFVDMEYFGWDDPVKLVADVFWHPALANLEGCLRSEWVKELRAHFLKDPVAECRFDLSLPLYGLRWIFIILNQVVKQFSVIPDLSDGKQGLDGKSMIEIQIGKARTILNCLKKGTGALSGR